MLAKEEEGEKATGGIAGIANSITDQLKAIASLIVAVSYVAGLGFLLAGLFKFKQHKDNPTQVPVGTPIVLVALGEWYVILTWTCRCWW